MAVENCTVIYTTVKIKESLAFKRKPLKTRLIPLSIPSILFGTLYRHTYTECKT